MPAFVRTRLAVDSFEFRGSNPGISYDPAGFDSASGSILFRGSLTQLQNKFPLGASTGDAALPDAPSGAVMYCLGPQGNPEVKFGHIWCDVGWRGIAKPRSSAGINTLITANAAQQVISIALTASSNALQFPMTRDGKQVIAGRPYCPAPGLGEDVGLRDINVLGPGGTAITVAVSPWRVQVLGRIWSAHVKGVTIGDRTTMIRPPLLKIPNPRTIGGGVSYNWRSLPDPLVTWNEDTGESDGWFCSNYTPPSGEYALGSKILAFWQADYLWVDRFGP